MKRSLEIAWVAASLLLLLFGVRSIVHARYEYAWESWLRLPWSQKLQPLELTFRRTFIDSRSVEPPVLPALSESDVQQSMRLAADWLVSDQEPSGHFKYWYDPVRNQFSPPGDDSFHRQSLSSYSLTLAYESTRDPRYLESAQRSITYQSGFQKSLEPDKSYFYSEEQADLGASALPMLTMLRLREFTGDPAHDSQLKRLANFLIYLQQKYATGEFKSTYVYRGNYDIEKDLGWQSPISPGQAMLALALMYRSYRDTIYKDSVDRGLKFYSNTTQWKQEAFLPWTISACATMYAETGDESYADFVVQLADDLIGLQNLNPRSPAYGSFTSLPSITTASYMEGLGDALLVMQRRKDSARMRIYHQRAQLGYLWLMSLQDRTRSIGGFPESPYDSQIRIDYNAHAISALSRYFRFR